MEHPIKMDDLGAPLFLETPIFRKIPLKTNMTGWKIQEGMSMFEVALN